MWCGDVYLAISRSGDACRHLSEVTVLHRGSYIPCPCTLDDQKARDTEHFYI